MDVHEGVARLHSDRNQIQIVKRLASLGLISGKKNVGDSIKQS